MAFLRFDSRLAFLVPTLSFVGCKPSGPSDTTTDAGAVEAAVSTGSTAASVAARRTWPRDAPASNGGCSKHDDCQMIVWDGPSPPDPCCDARVGYLPVRKSYLEWSERYRKAHCAGVSCPTAPFPGAEPIQCARVARCVGGQCVDACKDPTYRENAPPPPPSSPPPPPRRPPPPG